MRILFLKTGLQHVDDTFRIAVGDLAGNILPFKDGLLEKPVPCVMAGMHYNTPWTRDAAFNSWCAAGLLCLEEARNTLLAVLTRDKSGTRIGGEYWDAVVWTTGAWHYYLYTGDREFLRTALEATTTSLAFFEDTELDPSDGLFRGGACFQDGVAGSPAQFAEPGSFIGHHRHPLISTRRIPRGSQRRGHRWNPPGVNPTTGTVSVKRTLI